MSVNNTNKRKHCGRNTGDRNIIGRNYRHPNRYYGVRMQNERNKILSSNCTF